MTYARPVAVASPTAAPALPLALASMTITRHGELRVRVQPGTNHCGAVDAIARDGAVKMRYEDGVVVRVARAGAGRALHAQDGARQANVPLAARQADAVTGAVPCGRDGGIRRRIVTRPPEVDPPWTPAELENLAKIGGGS